MGATSEPILTLDEFLALCEAAPEGVRYECVEGRPVVAPSPVTRHQIVVGRLYRLLDDACGPGHVAVPSPLDWVLWGSPRPTVRQPDVLVVRAEDADLPRQTQPPLVVVEVLSPATRSQDLITKRREYARAGAPHYWLVDPQAPSIEVVQLVEGDHHPLAAAKGEEVLEVGLPFLVRVVPAELTR